MWDTYPHYHAGWAMAVLGAGRQDIEIDFGNRRNDNGTDLHPSTFHTMRAIERGWSDAGGEKNGEHAEPNFLKPDKRWWLHEEPPPRPG